MLTMTDMTEGLLGGDLQKADNGTARLESSILSSSTLLEECCHG